MRILYKDLKHGTIKLRVENLDDLWYLSGILNAGDKVIAKTERRVKSKDDSLRGKSVREVITLGIEVENIDLESDMLRVSGKIVEGPDELIAKGSYHTFNIQKDTILKIIKEKWSSIELQRLKDAENSSLRSKILVVILDDRDATIALLRESKVFYYDLTSKSISGKYYKDLKKREKGKEEFYESIVNFIGEIEKKENISAIIISGPGFEPENFYHFILNHYPQKFKGRTFFERGCSGGISGVREILQKPAIRKISEKINSAEEIRKVNELLREIGKDSGLGIYSIKEVENASQLGAIEILLVNDDFFLKNRKNVERIINNVRNKSGKFKFINNKSEAGKQLASLGGIAAILRFKI